ncbi:MAG: DUF885 domain-containing protein [Planctomycetes bacterium]|nr:DUF885 domain-containing protein [Planctomycetota bacterium]
MRVESSWVRGIAAVVTACCLGEAPSAPPVAFGQSGASAELDRLLRDAWEFDLREDPYLATRVGDRRYNAFLPRVALDDHARRKAGKEAFLARAESIDAGKLDAKEREHLAIFRRVVGDELREHAFETHLIPITNREGFHVDFPDLGRRVPLESVEDYENYIARIDAFGSHCDEQIQVLREGVERGMTLPSVVLRGIDATVAVQIVDDAKRSALFAPFTQIPDRFPDATRARLARDGERAIRESLVPAYARLAAFFRDEYVPAARESIAASSLPRGREFYRHRVRQFTTLDLSPEQVHETGLAEARRIRSEMESIPAKAGFSGDLPAFIAHLRESPQYYATTPEQLLKETSYVLKRIDGELPRLFRTLPRTPYGIREIPAFIAPKTSSAYYLQPAGDGSRGGFFYVNTYNLRSRPLFEIEALSLHEAVPGHHLQIALAQELTDVPPFRRYTELTAFVEGWALYAERLGLEAGFYRDPLSDFGRLSFEMWRACRLVVDTGIHYLGWTREQAIGFMAEQTALSRHNIEAEVDRYIAWPGQALGYKIGELKIRELRAFAERELGDAFDLREFHEVVLGSGAVPLDILEQNVKAYAARRR